jgi:peptide methionine sulfoxide reductase MsrA
MIKIVNIQINESEISKLYEFFEKSNEDYHLNFLRKKPDYTFEIHCTEEILVMLFLSLNLKTE